MGDQLKEINRIIENEKFMIYGTGFVAERLCHIIMMRGGGYWDNVEGFAVTHRQNESKYFLEKEVKVIDEIPSDKIILVAVHIVSFNEIKKKLVELGFTRYIWIYPYFNDLAFGLPLRENIMLDVKSTWENLGGYTYQHIFYYLAIEYFMGKNDYGKDLYIKCMKRYGSDLTALKRIESFKDRVIACKHNGFQQEGNIKMSEPYEIIIDGLHRLTLAYYFNVDAIKADIYLCNSRQQYLDFYNGHGMITEEEIENEFAADEIKLLKEVFNNLMNKH